MSTKTGLGIDSANQTLEESQNFTSVFSQQSVLAAHSNIETADFEDTIEGDGPTTTTVTVHVSAALKDTSGTTLTTATTQASFDVSVTNQPATGSASGTAGTGVSG